jgi:hypothetical protein
MMKYGRCNRCRKLVAANGDRKYEDTLEAHYREEHPKEYDFVEKVRAEANKEYDELRAKYPNYYMQIGRFFTKPRTYATSVKRDDI